MRTLFSLSLRAFSLSLTALAVWAIVLHETGKTAAAPQAKLANNEVGGIRFVDITRQGARVQT